MAGRFLGLEEMCLFAFHHQTQLRTTLSRAEPAMVAEAPSCFSQRALAGALESREKFKKKILARGSRAGGRLLLLIVPKDREGWD